MTDLIIVDPLEGFGVNNGWRAAHLGVDRPTPKLYDYTCPADSRILSVGTVFGEIVGQPVVDGRDVGESWRLAEVATILVSAGQFVPRDAVIGRNALFRKDALYPKGAYRSPHQNGGAAAAATRFPFSKMVTHSKAQAAAIDAARAQGAIRQRRVKAAADVVRRMGPGTKYAVAGTDLKAGTIGNFVAYAYGPKSQGGSYVIDGKTGNLWLQGISGHWFAALGFVELVDPLAGLVDKTAAFAHLDTVVLPPPVTEQPPLPELPPVVVTPPVTVPEPEPPAEPAEEPPVTNPEPTIPTEPVTPDVPVVTTPPTTELPPTVVLPTSTPVTPEQEKAAAELVNDFYNGQLLVGDAVIKRIRTLVPIVIGPVLAFVTTRIPAAGDFLASVNEGWQELVFGLVSAGLGFGYFALASFLGRRWPLAERLMLGSSKRPVYIETKPSK